MQHLQKTGGRGCATHFPLLTIRSPLYYQLVLSLFTTVKPFRGHIGIIQRNAIQSWTRLHPDVEVILFGNDEGAAELVSELANEAAGNVGREFSIRHEPHVECNEFGTKRLDYLFARAQSIARHDLLCYINCDIILTQDFCRALQRVHAAHKEFLMVGRRTDLDITTPLLFETSDSEPQQRLPALSQSAQLQSRERQSPDWQSAPPQPASAISAPPQPAPQNFAQPPLASAISAPPQPASANSSPPLAPWEKNLRTLAARSGKKRTAEWIDYFAFTRGLYAPDMPPFVLRVHWDNWLVWKVLHSGKPVVDASRAVLAIHQNHDYSHHPQGQQGVWHGNEAANNARLAGSWRNLRTIGDATGVLMGDVLKRNSMRNWSTVKRYARQFGRVIFYDVWHPVWFALLKITRPLRNVFHLRARP